MTPAEQIVARIPGLRALPIDSLSLAGSFYVPCPGGDHIAFEVAGIRVMREVLVEWTDATKTRVNVWCSGDCMTPVQLARAFKIPMALLDPLDIEVSADMNSESDGRSRAAGEDR